MYVPTEAELQKAREANQAQQVAIKQEEARRTDWTPGTGCNPASFGASWAEYGGKDSYCVFTDRKDPCCGTTNQSKTQIKKPMGESCEYNDECDTGYCGGGTCMS